MTGPIYTRKGDAGETSLSDGSRVPKYSVRVEAYGTVDEANSAIGLARCALDPSEARLKQLDETLAFVQHRLMNCASMLATPPGVACKVPEIAPADVARLEWAIDEMTSVAGELSHFVLPAGCEAACRLHVARTVARRAERHVAELAATDHVDAQLRAFVNRTSDLLFSAARYVNAVCAAGDVPWDPAL